jgi:outer membrane receptor protein involved in Fe transport
LRNELRDAPQLFSENLATSTADTIRSDNKVTEDVAAAYIQGETRLGRLGILGGVRIEDTRVHGRGYKQEITPEERARRAAWVGTVTPGETVRRALAEFGNPTEATKSYTNVFPSVHFKYNFTDNLLARASFSTGTGRHRPAEFRVDRSHVHDRQRQSDHLGEQHRLEAPVFQ